MPLTEKEAQEIGADEDKRWQQTFDAVVAEIVRTNADYDHDRKLARELTSEMVATRREEEKLALASDEAVAHGLTKLRKEKGKGIGSLYDQSYFARVITDEEDGKQVEFKLGTASFPAQRIIDWRKAPISRLYYDFKEGDDFAVTIQGREREGIIQLRRAYQGKRKDLSVIETAQATLYREKDSWKIGETNEPASRASGHDGHLPPILSLITPDQFDLITRDADKPMIIQGIAGSGKTTVALHRLAWLLHEENADLDPQKCLIVMFNRSLKAYIETTLPEMDIPNVPIRTFHQWVNTLVTEICGARPQGQFKKSRELEQFKASSICLEMIEKYLAQRFQSNKPVAAAVPGQAPMFHPFVTELFSFYEYLIGQDLFWPKWELIRSQLKEQLTLKACDLQDDVLLLHFIFAEHGHYPAKSAASLGLCDHIVIDEAQDFGLVEIRALLNAVNQDKTVTIVGDLAQKIVMGRNFNSWGEMLKDAGFEEISPIALTVSYRTTQEILELAATIRKDLKEMLPAPASGPNKKERHGPTPTFIRAGTPQFLPHLVAQWIKARVEEAPHSLSAIICRWPKEAQALVEELRKLGQHSVKLGHRDQFDFSPGVIVTNVHQVKGLEFRNVLVVEPSEQNYAGSSDEERNLLYVAVTRAEMKLDFIGSTAPTKYLAALAR